MAWSAPCPECGTQNEPDGSGAVLCASCGRFYKVPVPGIARSLGLGGGDAAYGGMGEIEAHLSELDIPFQRVSETSIQVVRRIGPQTVHVTIDTARTIHIISTTGVKDLTLGDSASTRLRFDPEWKERYDFDLALEDKTFALLNAADGADDASAPATQPSLAPVSMEEVAELPPPPPPLGMERVPSSPTRPSQKPAAIAASMLEALRSVDQEEEPRSLAEISALIPKRADLPSVITDLTEEPTLNQPHPRAAPRPPVDDAPFPVPAVILPSTPDGRPPVLSPTPVPPPRLSPPTPPPEPEPRRPPSGSIHIGNGISRDVIDRPISARVEPDPDPEPLADLEPEETPPPPVEAARAPTPPGRPPFHSPAPDPSEVITRPSQGPFRPSGERRPPPGVEPATRPAPPVLHRFDEPTLSDETARVPTAPRAMAARARRSSDIWAALLGLALGAVVGLQVAAPKALASLIPPTAASEVRAGAQAAREGDVDSALVHFRRAVELDPRSAAAWRNLGVTYALRGDQVRSAEAYRKYLELEQDEDQASKVRALLDEK